METRMSSADAKLRKGPSGPVADLPPPPGSSFPRAFYQINAGGSSITGGAGAPTVLATVTTTGVTGVKLLIWGTTEWSQNDNTAGDTALFLIVKVDGIQIPDVEARVTAPVRGPLVLGQLPVLAASLPAGNPSQVITLEAFIVPDGAGFQVDSNKPALTVIEAA